MNKIKWLLVGMVAMVGAARAAEVDVVITTKMTHGGYATVAGRAASTRKGVVGVSVDNGGIRYSTIADPSGTWAIVFRHAATSFTVRGWTAEGGQADEAIVERLP